MVSAGGIIYASDMNKALASRVPVSQVSDPTNSAAIASTTEVVIATLPSTLYRANTAFQVVVDGYWNPANTLTSGAQFRLRKTNASGAIVVDWLRHGGAPYGVNGWFYLANRFTTTAAVTTSLVLTAALPPSGAGSFTMIGTAGRPRRVITWEIGDQADYVDDVDLT